MTKEVYLIPGLGADKRLFVNLDLPGVKQNYIEWIAPLEDETIENYAKRLTAQIKTDKPIVIGVSFGGMMAVEIGKLIETEKVILISSARSGSEIPFYFKLGGKLGLSNFIASASFNGVNAITCWFFGIKTDNEKKLLSTIIEETDQKFLQWAMKKIVNWKSNAVLKNLTLIQGTRDHLFPLGKPDIKIKDGGHFMIYNKAEEVSGWLRKLVGGGGGW